MDYLESSEKRQSALISRRDFAAFVASGAVAVLFLPKPALALASESPADFFLTDDAGRFVRIPSFVQRIAPLGVPAQTVLTTLLPESISVLATDISEDSDVYQKAECSCLLTVDCVGDARSYGALVADIASGNVALDLILDIGIAREGLSSELDELQSIAGVPVFFLDASFGSLARLYRLLGELLHCSARANEIAEWIERTQEISFRDKCQNSPSIFYAPRANGISPNKSIDVSLKAIEHIGANSANLGCNYDKTAMSVNSLVEQDADLVLFDDVYLCQQFNSKSGLGYEIWCDCAAVRYGRYLVSPALIHSWFGSMIFVQTIGILWLSGTLWFDACGFGYMEEIKDFYALFYGVDLEIEELSCLAGTASTGRLEK